MRRREFHYRWAWALRARPEAIWPLVSDTNRFNHDTGVPPLEAVPSPSAGRPNARRRLRLFRLGVPVEWEEEPFEWVWPVCFGVVRRYRRGPVAEMRIEVDLSATPDGGTRLVYEVRARPRNLLGLVAIPVEIGRRAARRFAAAVRAYDARATGGAPPAPRASAALAPGGAARLRALATTLVGQGSPADLVARLVETIERADDLALARLRPYVLADQWQAPRRTVLELCLLATRAGALDLRWDLLCPSCRGPKASHASLRDVTPEVHCESCQIAFTVDLDRLVELTFRPSPAIRAVEAREFCVGGPQVTPHVLVQQLLPPGAARCVPVALEDGRYRVRALARPGGQIVRVGATGTTEPAIRVSDAGWPETELTVSRHPTFRLENGTAGEQLLLVERTAWTDQAATAAEVTALQRFRDLVATEVLRPREQIAVGSLAFLFTDLRGSTRLYRKVGDAPAFGRVMSHFDLLRAAVAREGGAVVKTMGDAIMAAFPRPAAALRAALAGQRALAAHGTSLPLRAGIHAGPCIAVTQNERLDYFGSIVNIAARLEGFSAGGDVVVSAEVRADPEVAAWLEAPGADIRAEPFEGALKGFDTERFVLWRVTRIAPPGPGPGALTARSSCP